LKASNTWLLLLGCCYKFCKGAKLSGRKILVSLLFSSLIALVVGRPFFKLVGGVEACGF